MPPDEETVGTVLVEIRDLLKLLVTPPPDVAPLSVIAKPKASDWKYGYATTTTTEMKDVVITKARTGTKLYPTCAIVRCEKASKIDLCISPKTPETSEIIAPGSAPDNGLFIHWFPYGLYTVGTSGIGEQNKFWVRAQGVTEAGLVEAVIIWDSEGV